MKALRIQHFVIWGVGLALGFILGHIQESHWSEIKQSALQAEITYAKCEDLTYPEIIVAVKNDSNNSRKQTPPSTTD